ncbi:ABC transporter G family member 20 [Ixodes scapularis]
MTTAAPVQLLGFRWTAGADRCEANGKGPVDATTAVQVPTSMAPSAVLASSATGKATGGRPRLAVDVRGLRISYGRGNNAVETLRGIDLSLPEGKIYGLLGPSGCGKTTLLRCIVGRLKPRQGSVYVFGRRPGQAGGYIPGPGVGYMPQELTLYPEFSIHETLTYFGRLFRIEAHVLRERTTFLIRFLGLPEKGRLVKNLSGGQKRRVSLAAALIHRPPLLILDEPTVGVDPLLRQSIWHYLITLTHREAISVIITTHYIEEARLANLVGLMRQGRMLAQASPDTLMHQHGMLTLEEVFLKLCMADNQSNNSSAGTPNGVPKVSAAEVPVSDGKVFEASGLAASKETLAANSMTHLVRNNSVELLHNNAQELSLEHAVRRREPFLDAWFRTWALVCKSLTRLHRNLPIHHTLPWLDLYGYPLVSLHPVMYTPPNPCYVRAPHYQYPRSPWCLRAFVLRLIFCHLTARRLLLEGAIELRFNQLSSVVEPASQQAGLPTTRDPSLQTGGSSR